MIPALLSLAFFAILLAAVHRLPRPRRDRLWWRLFFLPWAVLALYSGVQAIAQPAERREAVVAVIIYGTIACLVLWHLRRRQVRESAS